LKKIHVHLCKFISREKLQNHFIKTIKSLIYKKLDHPKINIDEFLEAYSRFYSFIEEERESIVGNLTENIFRFISNLFEINSLYNLCQMTQEGKSKIFKLNRSILEK
jgi:hypothetical protein